MPHMILATLTSSHHHLLKESANKPSRCIMWPNFLKVAKFHREFSINRVPFSKNWTNKVQCSNNFWFTLYKLSNSNFVCFDEVGDDIENTFWELATFIESLNKTHSKMSACFPEWGLRLDRFYLVQLLKIKSLLTMPSNVLPLHPKQTFPPIFWIFTEGEGDGIECRLSS